MAHKCMNLYLWLPFLLSFWYYFLDFDHMNVFADLSVSIYTCESFIYFYYFFKLYSASQMVLARKKAKKRRESSQANVDTKEVQRRKFNQFSSLTQSCLTLCDLMNCSMPGLPVRHQFPESTQTRVHRVGDAIQLTHPLSSPSPPALNL